MTADVVVVGGGSAGCVLAARLSDEADRSVVVLEAGPAFGPGAVPDDVRLLRKRFADAHDWGDAATTVDGRAVPYTRARIGGGGSAINATMAFRCHPDDVASWGSGWSWVGLADAFDRVEAALPLVRFAPAELTPLQTAFVERCTSHGFPWVDDHNDSAAIGGVGAIPMNRDGAHRVSAAEAFLHPVWDRPNLAVRGDAEVARVVVRGGRAVGVELSGGEVVEAGEVVVAAGAVGTPRLLWRSGVDHPDLGRHLSDHVSIPLPLDARWADRGPTIQVMLRHGPAVDQMLFPLGGPTPTVFASPQVVDLRGRVTPDGIDWPFVDGPVCCNDLRAGLRLAHELFGGDAELPDDVDAYLRSAHRPFWHGCGTAGIGRVVDGDLRVDGVAGLRVCDASVIPTVPRVNPNLTVMAVAMHAATRW